VYLHSLIPATQYNLNFFCGFIVAASVYYGLCWVSPVKATSDTWLEVDEDAVERNGSLVYGVEAHDSEIAYGQPPEDIKGAVAKISV